MRGLLVFSALLLTAGNAVASIPTQRTQAAHVPVAASFKLSGSVMLKERPLPGTTLHYPGLFTPLLGPHGGRLAQRQSNRGQG